jgi:AhpD family alkylhydroperoxidase
MSKRLNFGKVQPAAYTAMDALDTYIGNSSISKAQQDLIKLRASQINGCAYCVDQHSRDARSGGESEQRVFLVSAWREAGSIFSEEERLLFQLTEEITLIHQAGVKEETYEKAIALLGEEKVAELIMVIITINAWNRIGVSVHMAPPKQKA